MASIIPNKPGATSQRASVERPRGGASIVPNRPRKKATEDGGGFFGALKRLPGDVGRDLYDAAVGTPAGLYYTGKALSEDAAAAAGKVPGARGFAKKQAAKDRPFFGQTRELGKAFGEQVAEDFRHPLRHPGNTALDIFGIASFGAGAAAKASAVSKAAKGSKLKALTEPRAPGTRTFKVGDLEVQHPESRAALTRGVQRVTDKRRQRAAEKNPTGRAARRETRKAGKALSETLRAEEAFAKSDAAALGAIGKKLKPDEQYALRVVAEEAPLSKRVAATKQSIATTRGAERRRHAKRLTLLQGAAKHIVDPNGKPELRPESTKLKAVYGKMEQVAGTREQLAKDLGLLTDEAIQGRKTAAGRAAMGAKWDVPLESLPDEHIFTGRLVRPLDRENVGRIVGVDHQARTATVFFHNKQTNARATIEFPFEDLATEGKGRMVGHEDFTASPEGVYVPDIEQKIGRTGRVSSVGGQGVIGHNRSPIREGYTGAQKRTAREPLKTTRAVAEAKLAVSRFARLSALREKLVRASSDTPRFKDDVAIRLDRIGQQERLPKDVRQFIDEPEELANLTPDEQLGKFDSLRSSLIAGDDKTIRQFSPEQAAEFKKLQQEGKIGWVPKKLLGELATPHAPLSASMGKTPVAVWDSINNAQRLAVLYLKPAYAVPNLLGNLALNLVQQGFAAPSNLARASLMQWKLGPELTAKVDTMMHEGFAAALRGETGALSAATTAAANVWGKGVDRPFRRASFIHEAKRSGFSSPEQLRSLFEDASKHDQLIDITKRANREIIDYGRLSHRERELVRRLIFFYPWVKGSTMYAGQMLLEHPGKAAGVGEVGRYGIERAEDERGPAPSFLHGAFPAGGGLVNPASAAILQTPAQVGAIGAGLVTGRVPKVAELTELPTPALSLASALYTGENARTGRKYPRNKRGIGRIAYDTLVTQTPQYRLQEQARGTSEAKLFKPSPRAGLMQFLLGGIYPREYDPARLRALWRREQKELGNR